MAWFESPKKKKRKRYHKSNMKKLQAVNEKYTAKFNALGIGAYLNHTTIYGDSTGGAFLSYTEMDKPAWEAADQEAERNLTWYQSLVSGNGFKIFASFVIAVVLVVLNFVSYGATTPLTVAYFTAAAGVAAAVAGYFAASAAEYYSQKAQGKAGSLESKEGAIGAYKNKAQRDAQSNALTNLMVYAAYEIYANGGIFKMGSAGSETFSHSLALDTTKGLRGDLQRDENAEKIHSRVGGDAAGGVYFHSKNLNVDFPLASYNLTADDFNDQLINKYRTTLKLLADAFVELNNLDFNANGEAQRVYNLKAERYTRPIKNSIYQNDFLEKLKNYNKNLRADFNWASDKMFETKKQSSGDIKGALGQIESLETFFADESLSDEFKAEYYIDILVMLLDFLEDFCDFKYFIYHINTWDKGSEGGDHASGRPAGWIVTENLANFSDSFSTFFNGKINKSTSTFTNAHGANNKYIYIDTYYSFKNFAEEDRIFYDFSDLGILKKYYYKTTNKTYNGVEIIALYEELLQSLYQGAGLYGVLFFETRAYKQKTNYYSGAIRNSYEYSNYMFLNLGKEVFEVFNKAIELPIQLKFYDFSKIERTRDNTDSGV